MIVCFVSAQISGVAAASRQLWSFARDGGFPGGRFLLPVRSSTLCSMQLDQKAEIELRFSLPGSRRRSSSTSSLGHNLLLFLPGIGQPWSSGRLECNHIPGCRLAELFVLHLHSHATVASSLWAPTPKGTIQSW